MVLLKGMKSIWAVGAALLFTTPGNAQQVRLIITGGSETSILIDKSPFVTDNTQFFFRAVGDISAGGVDQSQSITFSPKRIDFFLPAIQQSYNFQFDGQFWTGTFENPTFFTGTFSGRQEFESFDEDPALVPVLMTISNIPTQGGVIPEPATWAMLIAGFGLVGAAARRRRPTAVTA